MKRIFLILSMVFVVSATRAHDLKIAFFEIKENNGSISAALRVDRVEMLKALEADLSLESINDYISTHIKITSDNKVLVKAVSYELKEQVIEIKCAVKGLSPKSAKITVWNTVLLDQVEGHENVVIFKLHDKTRSFRMSEKRKEIIAKYDNI
ncbi:MAG: hypothetical protein NXI20_28455 [bacterium]|nr:hypothetical protein [bacterium]